MRGNTYLVPSVFFFSLNNDTLKSFGPGFYSNDKETFSYGVEIKFS